MVPLFNNKQRNLRLGDLLVQDGAITDDQLSRALTEQKSSGKRLGAALIDLGFLTEGQLITALEHQLGIEYIDLSKGVILGVDFGDLDNGVISADLARLVPKSLAQKYDVVPVKLEQNELYLAMADPLNFVAIEDIKRVSRKRVVPMISTQTGITRAISTLYGTEGAARAIEQMRQEMGTDASAAGAGYQLSGDDQAAPTVRLVSTILERAVVEKASDLHLEPRETDMRVRMRIDGVMHESLTVPKELQASVISRIKIMGGMDIAERRVPQDGRSTVYAGDKNVDLRISTLPTIFGENIVIRLLDKDGGLVTKESLGLRAEDAAVYESLIHSGSGVVFIAGPTGSGKSSTMNSMIHELNSETVNLITLEDPVEYNIDGVNQVQINERTGMTFANGLRAILRQDPDIIAVGEIRDGETAGIAMRAAITGHLVLTTIHTNDSVATIDRLRDLGVEDYLITAAMRGVISQRLVRRVCPHCREEYTPAAEDLAALRIPADAGTKFYRGRGCSQCFDTGYRGRIAVFEILNIEGAVKSAINAGAGREEILRAAKNAGMKTLSESSRRLIAEGVTTVEEVRRAVTHAEIEEE